MDKRTKLAMGQHTHPHDDCDSYATGEDPLATIDYGDCGTYDATEAAETDLFVLELTVDSIYASP